MIRIHFKTERRAKNCSPKSVGIGAAPSQAQPSQCTPSRSKLRTCRACEPNQAGPGRNRADPGRAKTAPDGPDRAKDGPRTIFVKRFFARLGTICVYCFSCPAIVRQVSCAGDGGVGGEGDVLRNRLHSAAFTAGKRASRQAGKQASWQAGLPACPLVLAKN